MLFCVSILSSTYTICPCIDVSLGCARDAFCQLVDWFVSANANVIKLHSNKAIQQYWQESRTVKKNFEEFSRRCLQIFMIRIQIPNEIENDKEEWSERSSRKKNSITTRTHKPLLNFVQIKWNVQLQLNICIMYACQSVYMTLIVWSVGSKNAALSPQIEFNQI